MKRGKTVISIACLIWYCLALSSGYSAASLQGLTYPAEYARSNKTYLIEGEIGHLFFHFWGEKGKVKNARAVLEAPAYVDVLYSSHNLKITMTGITRDGKQYKRWIVPLSQHLNLPAKATMNTSANLFILWEAGRNNQGKENLFWYIESDEEKGEEKVLELNVLPPLPPAAVPKKFKAYVYENMLFNCLDENKWERLFQLYSRIGIRGSVKHYGWTTAKKLSEKGWEVVTAGGEGWGQWGTGQQSYWGAHNPGEVLKEGLKEEDILITLKNGKKSAFNRNICQTYLIENSAKGQPYFEQIRKNLNKCYNAGTPIYGMINDYEMLMSNEISPVNSCFCDRCRNAFAAFAGLDAKNIEKLSAQDLCSNHRKEWLAFRYGQNGKMMEIFNRVIKDIQPDLKSIVCSMDIIWSGYPNYPIDVASYDAYIDEHWPMMYRTGAVAFYSMEQMVKNLAKPVVPIVNTCYPVGEHRTDSALDLYLNILSAAIAGSKGICFFSGDVSLDGEYITAIAKAMREISLVEDFLAAGKRVDVLARVEKPNRTAGESWVLPLVDHRIFLLPFEGKLLFALCNYSDKEAPVRIAIPKAQIHIGGGKYFLYDPIDGTLLKKATADYWTKDELKEGFDYKIPPKAIKFLEIAHSNPGAPVTATNVEGKRK